MPYREATARLQELIHRQDRVLTVMHTPSAGLAKAMDAAGAEAGFVGTAGVVGAYTGMEDVGVASIPECVMIGGWIARAVSFPVILDGDTGHGGIMAVRRLVEDSINAGLAGVRIDDQDIEAKRFEQVPGKAVIYLFRDAPDFSREVATVMLDDSMMGSTYPGTYFRWVVAPGRHQIRGYAGDNGSIILDVAQDLRGDGWGSRLMREMERLARDRGCRHVWLDTFSFQARPFYERLGYRVIGTLPDYPFGQERYFLSKPLEGPEATPERRSQSLDETG